jgi:pimeloyl-ACP methyl ester carboxylesterase
MLYTFPYCGGPYPLVYLVPGASWLSEEHPTTPSDTTCRLIAVLSSGGFATLRLERSGVGDSEGPPCIELDLDTELAYFRAGLLAGAQHARVDSRRVFLYGRSLGGMLAALLARDLEPRGVAVWGTSAAPWHDALLRSTLRQLRLRGTAASDLRVLAHRIGELQRLVCIEGLTPAQVYTRRPELALVLADSYHEHYAHGRTCRYLQQLQRADLAGAFRQIEAPVFAGHGGCDWLSELVDTQQIAAVSRHGEWLELPQLDHFMCARAGLQQACDAPFDGDFSPLAAEALVGFLRSC